MKPKKPVGWAFLTDLGFSELCRKLNPVKQKLSVRERSGLTMSLFSFTCRVSSVAPNRPPDVTTSADSRAVTSAVEKPSSFNSSAPAGCSSVNDSNVNMWLSKETDEQLQRAMEMSRLLTTSMYTPC